MKRRLNLRFALALLAVGIVFAGALHLAHSAQVRRSAGILRAHAESQLAVNQQPQAATYLKRYLQLVPSDTDALAKLGRVYSEIRLDGQAFMTLDQVLRREPQRSDDRRRLVQVAMRLRRPQDAAAHLVRLLQETPDDAVLHDQLGQCYVSLDDPTRAKAEFEAALKLAPDAAYTYLRLAILLRDELQEPRLADELIDSVVAKNQDLPAAYLARARYRLSAPANATTATVTLLQDSAAADLAEALKRAPEDPEALLLAAGLARRQNAPAEARSYLAQGIKLAPEQIQWYVELSQLEVEQGDISAAIAALDQGLKRLPEAVGLSWIKADLLLNKGDHQRALEIIANLRERKYPRVPLQYLAARIAIADAKWDQACSMLEECQASIAQSPSLSTPINYWLGYCYERLGNSDQQLAAYRRAATADRNWAPARLGVAGALMSAGRTDEAIEEYRQAVMLPKAPASSLVLVARLMLLRQLRLAPNTRNWQPTEEMLKLAESSLPDSADVAILWAEWFAGQGRLDEARQRLTESKNANPDELRLWLGLVAFEQRLGNQDTAAQLITDAEKLLGDSVELRLAKVRAILQSADEQAASELIELESELQKFSGADQTRLLAGLATAHMVLGDLTASARLWKEVASRDRSHLAARLFLFDLALRSGNETDLDGLVKEIREAEGSAAGPLSQYGEAVRRVVTARGGATGGLNEAVSLLNRARLQRPGWSRIPLLLSEIDRLRENTSAEADHLNQALDLGDRNPLLVQRLVALLYQQRRFAEADQVLKRFEERQTPFSQDLSRLASEVSFRIEDYDRAFEMAERAAESSRRATDHIWYGQLLRSRGRLQEAEAEFRQAIELDKAAPEPWVALVGHLSRVADVEDADGKPRDLQALDAVLEGVQQHIPAGEQPMVLAQCYLAMDQFEKAEQQFELALQTHPDDPLIQRGAADFFVRRNDPARASAVLETLLGSKKAAETDIVWARRTKASILLATDRRIGTLRQSLELVEKNLAGPAPEPADRRARALILSLWPDRRQRQRAIAEFEKLLKQDFQSLNRETDSFALAQLYQVEKNWPAARRVFQALLAEGDNKPAHVVAYVRGLLLHNELSEADLWRRHLETIDPASAATAEVTARLLAAEGQAEEAIAVLSALLAKERAAPPDSDRLVERLSLHAALLEELSRSTRASHPDSAARLLLAAEDHVRELVANAPERGTALAMFCIRQNRLDDALDVLEQCAKASPPEAVGSACVAVLAHQEPDASTLERVGRILLPVTESAPHSPSLLIALAQFHDFRADYGQAQNVYRRVLESNPNNTIALNNLAMLSALQKDPSDAALTMIQRAIEVTGPHPELLDSQGAILIARGRLTEAISSLQEALFQRPSATSYFHLARACHLAGDRTAARAAWDKAIELGLSETALHRLERDTFRELAAIMATPKKGS